MDIQDTKEQRQAFEAWCIQWNIASVFPLDNDGQYKEYDIHLLYCAWLQGQAAKAQAVPDGFVVVPKEPTQELLNKMQDFFVGAFENGLTGGQSIHCAYIAMIEAQEQAND